jgi:hypothetical protein
MHGTRPLTFDPATVQAWLRQPSDEFEDPAAAYPTGPYRHPTASARVATAVTLPAGTGPATSQHPAEAGNPWPRGRNSFTGFWPTPHSRPSHGE